MAVPGDTSPHAPELRERARFLVVTEGLSPAKAAERLGLPEGTVKRWATSEQWCSLREQAAQYAILVPELKLKALQKAIADPSPENIQAWTSIERTYPERHYGDRELKREQALKVFESFTEFVVRRDVPSDWLTQLQELTSAFFKQLS